MADRGTAGRSLALAVLGALAAGALAFASVNRTWARVTVATEGLPRTVVETTGAAAVPWVGALALVVVTGALALLPTRGRVRQVVAALVALASAGVALGALLAGTALNEALLADLAAAPAAAGLDPSSLVDDAERPWWRWLTVGAGLLGAAIGTWACLRGRRWPVMGSRYEAPSPASRSAAWAAPAEPDERAETDLWRAMDRGDDPT